MGCGWTVKDTDWSRVTAMEVINGASMRTSGSEGAFNGIAFWDNLLKQGHRITAIGGSDNHDATDRMVAKQSPVGKPATVVYADELSSSGIIAGVKSGRVFVDAAGLSDAGLDLQAFGGGSVALMGGEIRQADDGSAIMDVLVKGLPIGIAGDARRIQRDLYRTKTGAAHAGPSRLHSHALQRAPRSRRRARRCSPRGSRRLRQAVAARQPDLISHERQRPDGRVPE